MDRHEEKTKPQCSCNAPASEKKHQSWRAYLPATTSFILLLTGIGLDHFIKPPFFDGVIRLGWYVLAYFPVGLPVIKEGLEALHNKEFFTEFTLMVIATFGAFFIGEYPEGVAVMLFYSVGELFQKAAVNKAKRNIKSLLDQQPSQANVFRDNHFQTIKPEEVKIGEIIQVKAGEKVPLDGCLLSKNGSFDTSALTGESKPRTIQENETVLAGMLNLNKVVEIKVEKEFADSSLSKILEMVQNATHRKAKTELFIRKFAKIYTPAIFFLAFALVFIPSFFVNNYVFSEWLYRGLVFLVISCPCALVISIPLGYFGGIGAASHHGILFKGANYMDLIAKVNTVVLDKTGTLTKGVFKVRDIVCSQFNKEEFTRLVAALEAKSTHPIAKAIVEYSASQHKDYIATDIEEIPGEGLKGMVNGFFILAGNAKLMKKFNIKYDEVIDSISESIVVVAINDQYEGYIVIADEIKEDARHALEMIRKEGVKQTIMLSGDKDSITQKIALAVGVDMAYGDLLPQDKVKHVEQLKQNSSNVIAFVGDGINDAPVLALSDVGIAMGAMGSDAAIETADVVIQTDKPSQVAIAIKISKATRNIVIQNIILTFAIKLFVLILGAEGIATMWEAVFADVGVALLAILNAVRILHKKFVL